MPKRRTGPAPTQNGRKPCARRVWVEPSVLGVFATRSPFRPNPIGLTCVKLDRSSSSPTMGPSSMCWGPTCATVRPSTTLSPTFRLRTATRMRPEAGSRMLRGKSSTSSSLRRAGYGPPRKAPRLGRGPSPRSTPRGQQARAKPRLSSGLRRARHIVYGRRNPANRNRRQRRAKTNLPFVRTRQIKRQTPRQNCPRWWTITPTKTITLHGSSA